MNATPPQPPATSSNQLDVREIPCNQKHSVILQRWLNLEPGDHFVLINGHDPIPLYYQFTVMSPGEFDWEYEQRGPEVFAIRITRRPAGEHATPSFVPESSAATRCDPQG